MKGFVNRFQFDKFSRKNFSSFNFLKISGKFSKALVFFFKLLRTKTYENCHLCSQQNPDSLGVKQRFLPLLVTLS